jgi:hypothetical protein
MRTTLFENKLEIIRYMYIFISYEIQRVKSVLFDEKKERKKRKYIEVIWNRYKYENKSN